jgi:cation transport regulator ChaB
MRYERIEDLPFVCRINLPEAAQKVYLEAWNTTLERNGDADLARRRAWAEVRRRFTKEPAGARWIRRQAVRQDERVPELVG